MVAIDMLDIINAFLGFASLELHKGNAIGICKSHIGVQMCIRDRDGRTALLPYSRKASIFSYKNAIDYPSL